MTGNLSWAAALQQLPISGIHLSAQDLVDVCLLLALRERIHIFSFDPYGEAPQRLGRCLHGLGFSVCPAYDDALVAVASEDTVVAFAGPTPSDVRSPLRSVNASGAVLIAITVPDVGPISELADAVVMLPSPVSTAPGAAAAHGVRPARIDSGRGDRSRAGWSTPPPGARCTAFPRGSADQDPVPV